jgi:CheY-like chemotaxis protein
LDAPQLRILLAEDHPVNQKVVALILEPFEVDLTIVENGEQAISHWQNSPFDLVLMDMLMPVMDGLSAVRIIRQTEAEQGLKRTAIALLTANAMSDHARMAREAGCDHHIAKPLTVESLIADIEMTLNNAKANEAARP